MTLKCPLCKRVTRYGEPTAKFLTKTKVKYPNEVIGSRIVKEVKCCMGCRGEKWI
jgi:hypothetical protein